MASTRDARPDPIAPIELESRWWRRSFAPFRKAMVRGLAIIMPPLLTVVLLLWAWNIIDQYIMTPVEAIVRNIIVWSTADIRENADILPEIEATRQIGAAGSVEKLRDLESVPPTWQANDGTRLIQVGQQWIPRPVFDMVSASPGSHFPITADDWYKRYVELEHMPRRVVIPAFLCIFILSLYVLGRLFSAGMGRWIWGRIESTITRIPLINKVYSAVKQVTDFAFNETDIQFTRIVAVEYPKAGIWSLGFVVSDSFPAMQTAIGEPCVAVLVPTSPMPATGFVITIARSQLVDLNINLDQAIQFLVSCGVVVPPHVVQHATAGDGAAAIQSHIHGG